MKKVIRLDEKDIEKLVKKIIKENDEESNNYMFWQNLKTMKEAIDAMLEMDEDKVDEVLSNGHGWALDHISTSADDVEEVYHFLQQNVSSGHFNIEDDYNEETGSHGRD